MNELTFSYEWRTFEVPEETIKAVMKLPNYGSGRMNIKDAYLLTNKDNGILKLRNGKLKIKALLEMRNQAEIWTDCIVDNKDNIESIINTYKLLVIEKKRVMKYAYGCGVDITYFTLNCKDCVTLGLESKQEGALIEMKRKLGVERLSNESYAKFLNKLPKEVESYAK